MEHPRLNSKVSILTALYVYFWTEQIIYTDILLYKIVIVFILFIFIFLYMFY